MSTTFAIRTSDGELKPIAKRTGIGNGKVHLRYLDPLAEFLSGDTKVEPIDNTAQGIYTIGDINQHIANEHHEKPIEELEESWIKDHSKIERNQRNSIFAPLNDAWHKDHDFVEVTEWSNGEGWDITISDDKHISLHFTEFAVLKELIALLEKD